MKIIAPLVLVLLLVPTTKAAAQSNDPLSLLNALVAAEGSRDVEGATALYADDAVITNTRGRKVIGKEAIRRFVQGNVNAGIQDRVANPHVVGDAVTWSVWESTDFYVKLGVAPIEIKGRIVAQGGKIKSSTAYFPPTSLVKIRQACTTPQAQGILLFGQSCNEFLQQAKAQTESVAATLKPYSAETDYKSLQDYLNPKANW